MEHPLSSHYPGRDKWTFDRFVTIDVNEEAKRMALEFAHKQTEQNVLVISAAIGNGSTHLAIAILNEIELLYPNETVFYASYSNIQNWIRTNQKKEILNPDFLNSHSAILIDNYYDKKWLRESEKLFIILKEVKIKIILTCLEDDSVNIEHQRIRILPPSNNVKSQIIRNLLKEGNAVFPENVFEYLSNANYANVRELENLIVTILARQQLYKNEINLDSIKKLYKML